MTPNRTSNTKEEFRKSLCKSNCVIATSGKGRPMSKKAPLNAVSADHRGSIVFIQLSNNAHYQTLLKTELTIKKFRLILDACLVLPRIIIVTCSVASYIEEQVSKALLLQLEELSNIRAQEALNIQSETFYYSITEQSIPRTAHISTHDTSQQAPSPRDPTPSPSKSDIPSQNTFSLTTTQVSNPTDPAFITAPVYFHG
ncbi:MAG: hypothetical protein DHS80DRAFT_29109 [Piptocephalis tieghemiana]|nr:MAG: hypothetical protein DHS80DRAFT_29109 [Piptocephalis tieghemiana]